MALTLVRSLGGLATNSVNLTGATAGNLGVILYNLNNGTTTDAPAPPDGTWNTAIVEGTDNSGTPTGTFVAQFWKELTGSEGTVTIGGATTSGSRQLRYKEWSTTETGGEWRAVGNGNNTGRSTLSNTVGTGPTVLVDVETEAISYTNVAWHSSLASGTAAPSWNGWTGVDYDRFAGAMALRDITFEGSYAALATLASSLTRLMAAGQGIYYYHVEASEPDLTIPIGIKTASGIYWTTAIFKRP